jgi:hypothetical protein
LKCRMVGTDGLRRELIEAEDFCNFCKQHQQGSWETGSTPNG